MYSVWVEPVTGEIMKVRESCSSGDYLYDKNSGRAIEPVLIWSGDTVGQNVARSTSWRRPATCCGSLCSGEAICRRTTRLRPSIAGRCGAAMHISSKTARR